MTSRIESRPASIATTRSMPSAMPPCGGAPYFSASSRKPKRRRPSSSLMPMTLKTCSWTSGVLMRIEPPPSSQPSSDRGRSRASASRPGSAKSPVGRGERVVDRAPAVVGGLEHREVDDPQHVVAALGDEAEAPAELQAQRAERLGRDARLVGHEQQQVALGRAAARRRPRPRGPRPRNLAIGERMPPSSTKPHATALPPWRWTTSLSPSSSERDISRAPALSARTAPPPPRTDSKTLNSLPRSAWETSTISRSKRVSGRSEPKRSIASSKRHARPRRRAARRSRRPRRPRP